MTMDPTPPPPPLTLAMLLERLAALPASEGRVFGIACPPSMVAYVRQHLPDPPPNEPPRLAVPVLVDNRLEANVPVKLFVYDCLPEWMERVREQQQWDNPEILAYTLPNGSCVDKANPKTWLNWYPWEAFQDAVNQPEA